MLSKAPSIAFEWELSVFRALRALYSRVDGRGDERRERGPEAARAEGRQRHLALLAQIAAGVPVKVTLTSGAGGVRGRSVALPQTIALCGTREENERYLVVRALLAGAIAGSDAETEGAHDPVAAVVWEVQAVGRAALQLIDALPLFEDAFRWACSVTLASRAPMHPSAGREERDCEARRRSLLERFGGAGGFGMAERAPRACARVSSPVQLWGTIACERSARPVDGATPGDRPAPPKAVTSEAEAPKVGDVREVRIDSKALGEAVLQHTFEKIDTADAHHGGARDLDGTDELEDHLEALSEVPLGAVIRSEDGAASLVWADVDLETHVPDVATIAPGEHGILYDEWDARKGAYRRDFCTVYPTPWPRRDAAAAKGVISRQRVLVRKVEDEVRIHRARLAPQKRQADGDTIDIDAMVRHLASVRAGFAPPPRPYIRRVKTHHELGTTVLVDMSLSSDAWVENRRVLDIAREAVLVLGEVAERLGDQVQVLGFASHTRNRCRVFMLRDWAEPWSVGRARIASMEPQGFTRIGPALRHATSEVNRSRARRRMVLLLSDGRPTDFDRYEGAHGVADVRQAVREAHRAGVWVHGLTLDSRASETFSAMLGEGRWEVLRHVEALPRALAKVWLRASFA